MKKLLAVLLALAIALGGTMTNISHAEPELDKDLEVIILRLKKLFNISDAYDEFTQSLESNNEQTNFYLNWRDTNNQLPNISITTDGDGFVKSYSMYYDSVTDKSKWINKIDAENTARQWINKIAPDIISKIKLKETNLPLYIGDDAYNFDFYRVENNIPFYDNNLNIRINKYTGELNSYNANWDKEIEFPKGTPISKEKAKEAFKQDIGLHLIYKNSYAMYGLPRPGEMKYFLAYSTLTNNKAIDAFTGKAIDVGYYRMFTDTKVESVAMADGGLTPLEKEQVDKLKGLKTIKEIENIGRKVLELDDSFKLENENLFQSWNNVDEFQWMLSFRKYVDENNVKDANISLNAKTGELISFNQYLYQEPEAKPAIDKKQSLELAKEYINKNLKDKVGELDYIEEENKDGALNYNFRFIRKTDGVYIENDGVNITIDAVNKKVVSFYLNWYKGKLPSKANIITLDKAYEILFEKIDYQLRYVKLSKNDNQFGNIDDQVEIKLVYDFNLDNQVIIHPATGNFLDNQGNEYKDNWITEYTDIQNSYAKKQIETLSEYGIAFKESKFRPKDEMKQSEFLFLLWKSLNNSPVEYKDYQDEMYKQLKNMKIVRDGDKDRNSSITKEDAVIYLIRTLSYDKIADAETIFEDIWKDSESITTGLKGYLNIAYALGIVKGDGETNNINPHYILKREDGASIIYNYLFMK